MNTEKVYRKVIEQRVKEIEESFSMTCTDNSSLTFHDLREYYKSLVETRIEMQRI